jgi:hypothetical protein
MPSAEERADRPSGSPIIGVAVLGALTLVGAAVVHYEFSFAPRVSPSAEPPAVIAAKPPVKFPGKVLARVPDADGVVRASSPADSAMASAYTLAGLLKRMPVDPAAFEKTMIPSPDFVAAGKILGLDARSVEVREDAIQKDLRPMILPLTGELDVIETAQSLEKRLGEKAVTPGLRAGSRIRYVVLGEVHGSEAVLLDPLAGRMVIPLHDLVKRVEGKGVVWIPLQKK